MKAPESNTRTVWLHDGRRILSFHPEPGFQKITFLDEEKYRAFLLACIQRNYRFQ